MQMPFLKLAKRSEMGTRQKGSSSVVMGVCVYVWVRMCRVSFCASSKNAVPCEKRFQCKVGRM